MGQRERGRGTNRPTDFEKTQEEMPVWIIDAVRTPRATAVS